MTDDSTLPSFERPPVNEVVLSVAFDRPLGFGIAHIGDFWHRRLRQELPEVEEQPPYQPPVEVLGSPSPAVMNIQLLDRPPSPRLWAKSADGTKLVQLQANWFASNWRDAPDSTSPYPRWPALEELFLVRLHQLVGYLAEEGFGDLTPRQCEVTYINQIRPGAVWADHSDLDKVLTLVGSPSEFLPHLESLQMTTTYRMRDAGEVDRGRLHVSVQPAFQREDNVPIIILTLVSRGEPIGAGEDGMLQFLRMGHEWAVRGFAAVTTTAMHEEWGRRT